MKRQKGLGAVNVDLLADAFWRLLQGRRVCSCCPARPKALRKAAVTARLPASLLALHFRLLKHRPLTPGTTPQSEATQQQCRHQFSKKFISPTYYMHCHPSKP